MDTSRPTHDQKHTNRRNITTALWAGLLSLGVTLGLGLTAAAPSSAVTIGAARHGHHASHHASGHHPHAHHHASFGKRVLAIARSKYGAPYVYGAAGPNAFDCSGFTSWVYARAGKHLPRTSSAQAGAVRRESRAAADPGDLVFFYGSSGVYHVGIYAGGNDVIHAPYPGRHVGREHIWTSAVFFGKAR